jgi:hypothetical protein
MKMNMHNAPKLAAHSGCTGHNPPEELRYGVRRLALSPKDGVLQYVYRRAEIPSHNVGPGRR